MADMPRQGERSPFPVSVCIKEEKNPESAARIGSTKSLSPLFCVRESMSVVVYSLAVIVSSEFQVNTNMRVLAGAAADTTTGGGVFGHHPANDRDGPSFPHRSRPSSSPPRPGLRRCGRG
jgi:hypothetical protein